MFCQHTGGVILCLGVMLQSFPLANAQSIPLKGKGAVDCTQIEINYVEDPSLTREENIRLMDQALIQSLSKFDECMTSKNSSSSTSGGNSGSAGAEQAGGGGESIAASDMSGTEKQKSKSVSEDSENQDGSTASLGDGQPGGQSGTNSNATTETSDNGRIPEDIPSADNDSVLEGQIRQAAMNESDPVIREKLWNEYRKYKGQSQAE